MKEIVALGEPYGLTYVCVRNPTTMRTHFLTITPFPPNRNVNQFNMTKNITVKYLTKNEPEK